MGDGRDVLITSFNMSGTFNLGSGDDLFISEGDVNFNGNATDILVNAGPGNDIIAATTDFCFYRGEEGDDVFISDASRASGSCPPNARLPPSAHEPWAKKEPSTLLGKVLGINLATSYFHRTYRPTIIGAEAFHFRVRNGTGWFHLALVTRIPLSRKVC